MRLSEQGNRLVWGLVGAVLVIGVAYVFSEVYSASFSATAEPLQNAGTNGNLRNTSDYSGASAIITRHESSDLTIDASDLVTTVNVQGTKVSGGADVQVDLLNTTGGILDTTTITVASASGTYDTTVSMAGTVAYHDVATVKAIYTAAALIGGEIAIYREATAGDAITTADFDHLWDTTVTEDSTVYNLNVDNKSIELQASHYLVLYGSRFDTTSSTNRSEVQSQLVLAGADLPIGWSQGYMRRTGGADELFTSGGGIIKVATDNDPLILRSFRTDDNTGAGVARVANTAGVQLLRLYEGWSLLRLSKTATQVGPTTTTFMDITYDQQDEIDTADFGHTAGSANITLKTAGHYMVFANTFGSNAAGTNTAARSLISQKLTLDGGDIDGTQTTIYIRGGNSTREGAVTIGTIIETTLANQVLNVEINRLDGTLAWTINQTDTGATVNRSAITIAKLGEGADYIRLDDTGTDDMNPTALTALGWNVEDELDTESFTHSDATITAAANDKYLFLTSNYATAAGLSRVVYSQGWTLNGGTLIPYGQTGRYNRTSGAEDVGNWSGILFDSLTTGDYIQVVTQAIGAAGTVGDDIKGVQGLRLRAP